MDETSNVAHVEIARLKKMRKLITALDVMTDRDWDLALAAARRMNDVQWAGLATQADVPAPSTITQKMVIDSLTERLRIRRKIQSDPNGWVGSMGDYAS